MNSIQAPDSDVVITTMVTLGRNFADIPFEPIMSSEDGAHNISRVETALENAGQRGAFSLCRMADLTEQEREQLAEHMLITRSLAQHSAHGAAFLSRGKTLSILVNEEEHVRISGMLSGRQLERAADLAYQADNWIDQLGAYAYDRQFGYLSVQPALTGSGLQAMMLLHLPMRAAGQIHIVKDDFAKNGLALRPWREENGDVWGSLFILSGAAHLGQTEEDMLTAMNEAVEKLIGCERALREKIFSQDRVILEDRVDRALALINVARIMNEHEMTQRISDLRLGTSLGLVEIPYDVLDAMMMDLRSSSLDCGTEEKMTDRQRDMFRAKRFRELLAQ